MKERSCRTPSDRAVRAAIWAVALPLLLAAGPPERTDRPLQDMRCGDARAFLADRMGMATVVEADSIDDWRTHRRVPGCRITAAGLTRRAPAGQAAFFFDELRGGGWTRTPHPHDAPNEASLRFRKNGSDCVFSFYTGGLLGTEAEGTVDDARVPEAGEVRYNFVVLCMEAVPT